MMRKLLSSGFCGCAFYACALALPTTAAVAAEELPVRKAGLWEMKIVRPGAKLPDMTMQHCTVSTTDKEMNNSVSPLAKQICSKQDVVKTATGYVSDSVYTVSGVSMTTHAEIVGDFNSGYTVTSKSHSDKDRPARRSTPRPRSKPNGSAPASRTRSPAIS